MSDKFRKTAFKVGFLTGLAECGVTPTEFLQHIKQAFTPADLITGPLEGLTEVGKSAITTGADVAGGAAKAVGAASLLAPLAVGAATGATAATLDAPTVEDIESLRKDELIGLYKRLTDEIKARKRQKAGIQ